MEYYTGNDTTIDAAVQTTAPRDTLRLSRFRDWTTLLLWEGRFAFRIVLCSSNAILETDVDFVRDERDCIVNIATLGDISEHLSERCFNACHVAHKRNDVKR